MKLHYEIIKKEGEIHLFNENESEVFCSIYAEPLDDEEIKRAELICRAVNNYDELVKAVEVALWDLENGEYEAQKQGKPRLIERAEIYKNILNKINL